MRSRQPNYYVGIELYLDDNFFSFSGLRCFDTRIVGVDLVRSLSVRSLRFGGISSTSRSWEVEGEKSVSRESCRSEALPCQLSLLKIIATIFGGVDWFQSWCLSVRDPSLMVLMLDVISLPLSPLNLEDEFSADRGLPRLRGTSTWRCPLSLIDSRLRMHDCRSCWHFFNVRSFLLSLGESFRKSEES